ncbi:TonB family protein [Sphingobium sp. AP49]|uniref:TonB family protein n=1 Tax=Sphingobium sp. AP49 TaxID=1144307 RepID=UPI00068FEFDA|nr:TonB family protein [Sphingobium sp. AP49]WHO37765.1 TonB family protein [Sphingobium sp. AP49]
MTGAVYVAALIAFLLYRPTAIAVISPARPLVVTLLPLAPPSVTAREREPLSRAMPQKKAQSQPVAKASASPPMVRSLPAPVSPAAAPTVFLPAPPIADTPLAPPPSLAQARAEPPIFREAAENGKDSWEGRVLARLQRFKRYPSTARGRREQGVVMICFRLDRQGRALSSSIARSSGSAILDAEALATLARADPLPPIPANRPDEIELVVPIEFTLHSR